MSRWSFPLFATVVFWSSSSLVPPLAAAGSERVSVHSIAEENYELRKFPKEGPRPESYVFYEGRYFGGESRDRSIAHMSFRDLATTLGRDLAKQNYFPAGDLKTADLLIVVHWGTTLPGDIDSDLENQLADLTNSFFDAQSAADYPELVSGYPEIQSLNTTYQMSVDRAIAESARILGYSEALAKERERFTVSGMTDREGRLRAELVQARYFVILMAWDNRALQQDRERRLLWSTRFSMRAVGKNFTEALPALSRVAGNYFGRRLQDLETQRTHLGEGEVEMSEIEVLGTESPSHPAPREQ